MKQYTNQDQTAKLIELGYTKPKGWGNADIANNARIVLRKDQDEGFNYSIGELINLLPRRVCHEGLEIVFDGEMWMVMYGHQPFSDYSRAPELVDALFYFCASWKNGKDMEEYKKYIQWNEK